MDADDIILSCLPPDLLRSAFMAGSEAAWEILRTREIMTRKPAAETRVALRIADSNLEPENISQRLGLKPTKAHRRGDPNIGRTNRTYSNFSSGLWILESNLDEEPLERKLESLISRIRPKQAEIDTLVNDGLEIEIIIGVFGDDRNTMFHLNSQVLRELAQLGIDVTFDVYS